MERAQPKPPGHSHLSDAEASAWLKEYGMNRHERRRTLALAKRTARKKKKRGV